MDMHDDWQGRRQNQVENNYKGCLITLISLALIIILTLSFNIAIKVLN